MTKFHGENVPIACLFLVAAAKALGDKDLPTNAIQKVLKGFTKSLTDSFNDFVQAILLCNMTASIKPS
jgi:hypothetical protein